MTPGTYLRKRREAAGLELADVALMLPTEPHMDALGRAEWLRQIEADQAPIGINVIAALRYAFAFDASVLQRLGDIRMKPSLAAPRICRVCACSQHDACVGGCAWVDVDLCSSCAPIAGTAALVPPPERAAA